MSAVIDIRNLHHAYGSKKIYAGLDLTIESGTVYGLLGKNGVGKSTLINILMGYIRPQQGECLVFGEPSHCISATTRKRIALLYEGFISYDMMSVRMIEGFFSAFYEKWNRHVFYELLELMDISLEQHLSTLSFGQKSQVVLGLLFAQNADLLILDDYSMGLDAGYRRLFVDYLRDYLTGTDKTVLITSHIMGDLEQLVDQIAIVDRTTSVFHSKTADFCRDFRCYTTAKEFELSSMIHRHECVHGKNYLYSFASRDELEAELNLPLEELALTFEEKFLGYVGKY
jgi:ABC-2 type transport system ATP-binding protein